MYDAHYIYTFIMKINYLFENISKDRVFLHSVGYMAHYMLQHYIAVAYQFKPVLIL